MVLLKVMWMNFMMIIYKYKNNNFIRKKIQKIKMNKKYLGHYLILTFLGYNKTNPFLNRQYSMFNIVNH